jgi:hypothetical protein
MGKGIRYTDEFKQEAVNQVVIHGYSVIDVSGRLGDKYFDSHLSNLDVVSKWVVIPRLVCSNSIDKSGPAFSSLKKLIKSRNKLVHNKSKELDISRDDWSNEIDNGNGLEDAFYDSLKCVFLIAMEMDYVTGQLFNPIGTLDKAFSPMLEIPESIVPLYNECKNITLRNKGSSRSNNK